MIDVEGYTAIDPIDEDDLVEELFPIPYRYDERKLHNADGYVCELAGSRQCVALGHVEPEVGWYEADDDAHPMSWEGEPLCVETKFEAACTQCEAAVSDCEAQSDLVSRDDFWKLVSA